MTVKLHWRPLPPSNLQGTVWQSLPQVNPSNNYLHYSNKKKSVKLNTEKMLLMKILQVDLNVTEFEQLFEVKDNLKKSTVATAKVTDYFTFVTQSALCGKFNTL